MSILRMQADKAWLDYQAIILDLLKAICHRKGSYPEDTIKCSMKNIKVASGLYSMTRSMEHFYELSPDYGRLSEIAKQIEAGNLSPEGELARILESIQDLDHVFKQNKVRELISHG